jgi:hypothetical protein
MQPQRLRIVPQARTSRCNLRTHHTILDAASMFALTPPGGRKSTSNFVCSYCGSALVRVVRILTKHNAAHVIPVHLPFLRLASLCWRRSADADVHTSLTLQTSRSSSPVRSQNAGGHTTGGSGRCIALHTMQFEARLTSRLAVAVAATCTTAVRLPAFIAATRPALRRS